MNAWSGLMHKHVTWHQNPLFQPQFTYICSSFVFHLRRVSTLEVFQQDDAPRHCGWGVCQFLNADSWSWWSMMHGPTPRPPQEQTVQFLPGFWTSEVKDNCRFSDVEDVLENGRQDIEYHLSLLWATNKPHVEVNEYVKKQQRFFLVM